ncbi:MAG: type II secretion system protein [Phycisphaerae bacterium]|nr:type II secretion system protein [Phycisphaerae bacterium]
MDHPNPCRKQGFTLIELLVVISIIALLVSILMPALSKARQKARNVVCLANMHQWGLIWSMYTSENNGRFPGSAGQIGWARGEWIIALRDQYDTKSEILICPTANKPNPNSSQSSIGGSNYSYKMGLTSDQTESDREICSYGANCWIYDCSTWVQSRDPKLYWRNNSSKHANYIPIFGDCMWRGGAPYDYNSPPTKDSQWEGYGQGMKHFALNRHDGKVNFTFMDMSARPSGIKELWRLRWHKSFKVNGPYTASTYAWPAWIEKLPE